MGRREMKEHERQRKRVMPRAGKKEETRKKQRRLGSRNKRKVLYKIIQESKMVYCFSILLYTLSPSWQCLGVSSRLLCPPILSSCKALLHIRTL
jgi:hypothetical protein